MISNILTYSSEAHLSSVIQQSECFNNIPQCFYHNSGSCSVFYSVLVSLSCPKALYHLESDNIICITLVVDDWLGLNPYHHSSFCTLSDWLIQKIQTYFLLELLVCIVGIT